MLSIAASSELALEGGVTFAQIMALTHLGFEMRLAKYSVSNLPWSGCLHYQGGKNSRFHGELNSWVFIATVC